MGCAYIIGGLPPAPNFELDPLPPLADEPPEPLLDPLPAFDGIPDIVPALPAEEAQAVEEVKAEPLGAAGYATSAANQMVSDIMTSTGALAVGAQSAALNAVEMLAQYTGSFTPMIAPVIPGVEVGLPEAGEAPKPSDLTPRFPIAPEAPADLAYPALDIGEPPDYAVADINLMDIPMPDPLDAVLPVEPDLAEIGTAVEPGFVLPAVPTLLELSLPDAPVITLPVMEAHQLAAPDAPSVEFAYSEVEYGTTLLTAIQTKIAALAGDMTQSGIDEGVEQAIWDRAADREALLTHRATGEAVRLMKSRGFRMPESTMVRVVQQALQGGLNRAATIEREIHIEQARLRQQNFRFAIESAVALESRMIEKHNMAQARALEAAKATVLAQIQIFNARVQLYQADITAFGMKAQIFRSRLEAALSHIEVYKAQLEAQRVVGEINSQKVAIYRAQIEGVRSTVDVFRTRVEAAKAQVASTASVVDQFRSRIAAYEAQVSAKMADYDAYAARVRGQSAKAQLFSQQVSAYRSQVGAYDALAKAKIGVQQLRFKQANEFPLELYKAKIDAYKSGVGASMEQLKSLTSVFSSRIKAFAVQENAKGERVDAEIKIAEANAMASLEQAKALLEAGKTNLTVAESASQTAQNNLRSAGQLAGQLAASAVAAQSVNASISESGSFGVSNSAGASVSNATNTSAVTSIGSSSSTNTSHSSTSGMSFNNSKSTSEGRSYNRGQSHTFSTNKSVNNRIETSIKNATTIDARLTDNVSTSESCTDRTTINE